MSGSPSVGPGSRGCDDEIRTWASVGGVLQSQRSTFPAQCGGVARELGRANCELVRRVRIGLKARYSILRRWLLPRFASVGDT